MTDTHALLMALAGFAALGLAAAPPAQAQTLMLGSGDAATVSGAGTVGTVGGKSVANTTSTYDDTGTGSFYAVDTTGNSTFTLGPGGTLTDSNPDAGNGLQIDGSGAVTITSGSASSQVGVGLFDEGSSPVTISGGSIIGGEAGLLTEGTGVITITGGTVSDPGGGAGALSTGPGSTIDLFGTGFSYTARTSGGTSGPTLITSGDLPANASGTLTGTLLDGQAIAETYSNGGTIEVNVGAPPVLATPEPSALAVLTLGMLSLSALTLSVHRRNAKTV